MLTSVTRSFIISRALVMLFAIFGISLFSAIKMGYTLPLPDSTPWYLSIWYQWDANWYMSIATNGYDWFPGDQSNVAFFPLYPFTVSIAGWLLGGRYLAAGMLLSSAFLLAGMLYMYRLIRDDYGERIAGRATWFLAIFPTTVFFSAFYSESLFLLTSVAAFYHARRGNWALAGLWGFLAALTRITGMFILVPLTWEYLSQRSFSLSRIKPSLLWIIMVPAGLVVYAAYLYFAFGEPLAFAETQVAGWGHEVTTLSGSFINDLSLLVRNWEFWVVYELAATVFLFLMIFLAIRRKLPASYIIYMLLSLLIPLAGGTSRSISRYLLVIFPVFIIMALVTEDRKARWVVTGLSVLLMCFSTAAFVTGRWVA